MHYCQRYLEMQQLVALDVLIKNKEVNMTYKPTWAIHEKDMHSDSLEVSTKATNAFTTERDKELKTSAKARGYEKSRREEAQKQKPEFVRKNREAELAPLKRTISELKQGGTFDTGLKYIMPGFVLIKPVVTTKTDAGIFLTTEVTPNTNIGIVMQISGSIVDLKSVVEPPFKVGDKVMIRKGLPGLEMSVKDEFCLFMRWHPDPEKTDVLAVVEEAE